MSSLRELSLNEQDMVSGGFDITVYGDVDFSVYDPENFIFNFDSGGKIYSVQFYEYGQDNFGGQSALFGITNDGLGSNAGVKPQLSGALDASGTASRTETTAEKLAITYYPNGQRKSFISERTVTITTNNNLRGGVKASGSISGGSAGGGSGPLGPRAVTPKDVKNINLLHSVL
jgi:hypothetical protein